MNRVFFLLGVLLIISSGCAHVPMITLYSENNPTTSVHVHTLKSGDSRVYLIEGRDGLIMVDAGWPGNEKVILDALKRIGRNDLRLIFITHAHYDHYGSAMAIREATGAPVAVHVADAKAMAHGKTHLGTPRGWGKFGQYVMPLAEKFWPPKPAQADILVEDGFRLDEFGLDAVVMHTPGHTPGSCSLVVQNKLVFVGDLMVSRPFPSPQRFYAHNWDQIPGSVERVLALDPVWVFPGHGKPLTPEGLKRLGQHMTGEKK